MHEFIGRQFFNSAFCPTLLILSSLSAAPMDSCSVSHSPNLHVLRFYKKFGNLHWHRENMQTIHRNSSWLEPAILSLKDSAKFGALRTTRPSSAFKNLRDFALSPVPLYTFCVCHPIVIMNAFIYMCVITTSTIHTDFLRPDAMALLSCFHLHLSKSVFHCIQGKHFVILCIPWELDPWHWCRYHTLLWELQEYYYSH